MHQVVNRPSKIAKDSSNFAKVDEISPNLVTLSSNVNAVKRMQQQQCGDEL